MFAIWLKKDNIAPREYFDFDELNNIQIESLIRFLVISESSWARMPQPEIRLEERLWIILEITTSKKFQSMDNSTKYL